MTTHGEGDPAMDATKPWFEFGRAILDNALQDACNRIDLLLAAGTPWFHQRVSSH